MPLFILRYMYLKAVSHVIFLSQVTMILISWRIEAKGMASCVVYLSTPEILTAECFRGVFIVWGKKIQFSLSKPLFLRSKSFKINFIKNSIQLKSILLDLDFNLIYTIYILWIGFSFAKSRFSNMDNPKNPIQNFNLNF